MCQDTGGGGGVVVSLLHDGQQVGHVGRGPGVQSPEDKFEACGGFTDIIHVVRKQPIILIKIC